jgi:replicative DNA helicase
MSESYLLERDPALDALKSPPNSIHAEQSVLGSLIIENGAWDVVADKLSEVDFYLRSHKLIFRTISQLAEQQIPFDIITLSESLKSLGQLDAVGGLAYLIVLSKDTPCATNVEAYANIVREKSVLRQLISAGTTIANSVHQTEGRSTQELLENAEQLVFKIAEQTQKSTEGGFINIRSLAKKTIEKIELLAEMDGSITGASTGFDDLDTLTSGLQPADLVILAGRPSMGKCFGKGTKILLYSGEIKHVEDIKIGDCLMGDDSTPRHVLSLARGREMMYWIRQNKAIDYRVNESHILSLKRSRNEGKHENGDILNLPLLDYLNASEKFKSNYKGYKVAIDFAVQDLPLNPYFLGLWLGDGNTQDVRISSQDNEVEEFLLQYAEELGLQLTIQKNEGKCPLFGITSGIQGGDYKKRYSLTAVLKEQNLIGNKHIPQVFLINSHANRLALLAGLIDSDGHYDKACGGYEITQNSLALATQIKFLCDSLGYRTSLIEKQATISEINFESTVYRVRFFGNVNEIPVKIERKKAKSLTCNRSWNQTGITVEMDCEDQYFGFEIDGNKLFLLDDMTVVHNTTVAINIAENFAIKNQKPVAIFSMEMPGDAIVMRMMSSLGGIEQQRIRSGDLDDNDWPRLTTALTMLNSTKLFIDDSAALSPTEVRARSRRLAKEHGQLGLIVIDYLQLMQSPSSGDNRVQQISDISRGLKALAKELNVPVIALSQLNRNLEQRPNKRPVMSDLRDSGAIEQDADLILFIYRDEVYNENSPDKGTAELIIGKQRNGPLGTVRLMFQGAFSRFQNCANPSHYSSYNDE